jgi:hypothetical protein
VRVSEERPYVSYSQLALFERCGEAFRRRYIEREKIPPGVAAIRGRAVHGAAELNHRQKIASGVDLPLGDLVDAAATAFDASRAEGGVLLTPEEASIGEANVLGRAKDRAVKLTGLYAHSVAPTIQPALVEERVRIMLPDAPVDLLGILDVATVDRRVKDLKTAARSKTQAEADQSLQLSLYGLAYRAHTGQDAAGLDMEVLVDTSPPKHQRLSTTRRRSDYLVLVARLNAFLRARDAGIFPPAELSSWGCNERWCGYWRSCVYVNRERRAAASRAA